MQRFKAGGISGSLSTGIALALSIALSGIAIADEGTGSASKAETVDYLAAVKEKAAQIESVKAKQVMTMAMMGQEMEITSRVFFAAPDKSRMETTMEGVPGANNMVVISDGKVTWTHMPSMGMTQKIDMERIKEALGKDHPMAAGMRPNQSTANFSNPFSAFREDSIRYVTTEAVSGVDCYVFEAELSTPEGMRQAMGKMMPQKVKAWFGKEDGIFRRQVFLNPDGSRMMEMTFSDVEINPELDEGLFTYTPKPDEKVMDMTDMVLRMSAQFGKQAPGAEGSGAKPEGSEAKPDEGSAPKPEGSEPKSEGSDAGSETLDRGI